MTWRKSSSVATPGSPPRSSPSPPGDHLAEKVCLHAPAVVNLLGTNTYDTFEMRIFKRVIRVECPAELVRDLTKMKIDQGVDIELEMQAA